MDNDKDKDDVNFSKVKLFLELKKNIHVTKKNGEWLNGMICEPVNSEYFMLDEYKKGLMPVFYAEVFDVEEYKLGVGE